MFLYSGMIMDKRNDYTIYNSTYQNNKNYYLKIPNKEYDQYSLCIIIPSKETNFFSKESILKEINAYTSKSDESVIYAIPVLANKYQDNLHDDKIYQQIINEILSISEDIFNKMINDHHKKMEQSLYFIIKDEFSMDFYDWLSMVYLVNNKNYYHIFKSIDIRKKATLNPVYTDIDDSSNSGHSLSSGTNSISNNKPKVKVLIPKKSGYSNILTLSLIIIISFILGIGISLFLLK